MEVGITSTLSQRNMFRVGLTTILAHGPSQNDVESTFSCTISVRGRMAQNLVVDHVLLLTHCFCSTF